MTTTTWRGSARERRSLADVAYALRSNGSQTGRSSGSQTGKIALFIGAGVDKALTGRPLWKELLKEIAIRAGLEAEQAEALAAIAGLFPAEAADALRTTVGRTNFEKALYSQVAPPTSPISPSNPMAVALTELCKVGLRLLVTFNYSRDVLEVLTNTLVIERMHLKGWGKSELVRPIDQVHYVAIHGLVDGAGSSEVRHTILDRQSYDQALISELHYEDFLQRTLSDCTVLSVGLSWSDTVIRTVAARLRYQMPIASRIHVAILESQDMLKDLWKERALVTTCSVRPVFYKKDNHAQAAEVLGYVAKLASASLPGFKSWNGRTAQKIAATLDSWGDYESLPQREWFGKNWERVEVQIRRRASMSPSFNEWLALTRIERHLRHYMWVFVTEEAKVERRQTLWSAIAQAGKEVSTPSIDDFWVSKRIEQYATGQECQWEYRGLFEYALGAFELFQGSLSLPLEVNVWRKRLSELDPGSNAGRRAIMAQTLWQKGGRDLNALRKEAVVCQWEAIEAKLALDICEKKMSQEFKDHSGVQPRLLSSQIKSTLLRLARDAREVARAVGCRRREIGAVVLGSLIEDIDEAEASLIAINRLERLADTGVEPISDWGIRVGMLASLLDRANVDHVHARKWLNERCGGTQPLPSPDVIMHYWKDFHNSAALLAFQLASP